MLAINTISSSNLVLKVSVLSCSHLHCVPQSNLRFTTVNMWSKKQESAVFSFLICFMALGISVRGQSLPQCAAVGEYCQNHWDCCSNSCMTYLYRCMRTRPKNTEIYTPPLYVYSEISFDDLLALNFGNNLQQATEYKTAPPLPQLQNRFSIIEPQQQIQQKAAPTTTTRVAMDEKQNLPTLLSIVLQPQIVEQQEQHQHQQHDHHNHVHNHEHQQLSEVAQRELLSTTPVFIAARNGESQAVTTEPPCKEIGQKCYRHEECCSKLCHGFLHQCVT